MLYTLRRRVRSDGRRDGRDDGDLWPRASTVLLCGAVIYRRASCERMRGKGGCRERERERKRALSLSLPESAGTIKCFVFARVAFPYVLGWQSLQIIIVAVTLVYTTSNSAFIVFH